MADGRALDPLITGHRGGPYPRAEFSQDLDAVEADTAADRPQLLFFFSETSGSSRRAEGFLAQVLQRRRNHESFQLRRIDADRHAELAERFRIEVLPALVVVENKRVRARLSRPRGCADISEALGPWLR